MKDEMQKFSQTLVEDHYDNAIKIQDELKKAGNPVADQLLKIDTKDFFRSGFKMFPQVANNEYVKDELTYLEGAEDNLNGNIHNKNLVQAFIQRGHEVATKLE